MFCAMLRHLWTEQAEMGRIKPQAVSPSHHLPRHSLEKRGHQIEKRHPSPQSPLLLLGEKSNRFETPFPSEVPEILVYKWPVSMNAKSPRE